MTMLVPHLCGINIVSRPPWSSPLTHVILIVFLNWTCFTVVKIVALSSMSCSQCLKQKTVGLLEKFVSWKEEAGFLDLPLPAWSFPCYGGWDGCEGKTWCLPKLYLFGAVWHACSVARECEGYGAGILCCKYCWRCSEKRGIQHASSCMLVCLCVQIRTAAWRPLQMSSHSGVLPCLFLSMLLPLTKVMLPNKSPL